MYLQKALFFKAEKTLQAKLTLNNVTKQMFLFGIL